MKLLSRPILEHGLYKKIYAKDFPLQRKCWDKQYATMRVGLQNKVAVHGI